MHDAGARTFEIEAEWYLPSVGYQFGAGEGGPPMSADPIDPNLVL